MSWRHADVGWNKQISLSAGGNTQFICIIHPHVLGMSFAESYCRLYALLTEPFFLRICFRLWRWIAITNAACIRIRPSNLSERNETSGKPKHSACAYGSQLLCLSIFDWVVLMYKLKGGQPRPTISLHVNVNRKARLFRF